MIRIIVDNNLKEKLMSADEVIELCDESGETVFRVRPDQNLLSPNPSCKDWTRVTPDISTEEFQRLRDCDDWEGKTTSEVLDQLKDRS